MDVIKYKRRAWSHAFLKQEYFGFLQQSKNMHELTGDCK